MRYFDFRRLITKYKSEFKAITLTDGFYNDVGDWVEGSTTETVLYGAVISFKESKIYRSEGTITTKDKRLFTLEAIDTALQGSKAIYEGSLYSIEDNTENAKFTGVYAYTLRYVSAFKETRPDYDITEDVEELEQRLDGVWVASSEPAPDKDLTEDASDLEKRLDGVLSGEL